MEIDAAGEAPEDRHLALLTLAEAIHRGRTDMISVLVKRHGISLAQEPFPLDAQVKQCDAGDNALHLACRINRLDAVRALLRFGVDTAIPNSQGEMALREQVVQAFYMELLQNVCSGNVQRVRNLLQGGMRADQTDGSAEGTTLLHWAASLGQGREMVNALVQGGADVFAKTRQGKTALDEAQQSNGNEECIQALQEHMGGSSSATLLATTATPTESTKTKTSDETLLLRRKIEEQENLIDTLRQTVDQLLRENGVHSHVTRLQDHVGALTRQLAATAEQRDKLQNLYVASDRELERLARELAKSPHHNNNHDASEDDDDEEETLESVKEKLQIVTKTLEKERADGGAAVRMHLTYEADLRAEIKALHEQLLLKSAQEKPPSSMFPSLW